MIIKNLLYNSKLTPLINRVNNREGESKLKILEIGN